MTELPENVVGQCRVKENMALDRKVGQVVY